MKTPVRVVAFVVGLAAVFGLAFGVGRVVDPDAAPVAAHEGGEHAEGEHAAMGEPAAVHLALTSRELTPGRQEVSFQVRDQDGRAVTTFDTKHEKDLHLIVLDTRDLTDFQHVHPSRAADGTWSARLVLQSGTSYRMYADGSTQGQDFVATADIHTTGHHPGPGGVPEPATRDRVDRLTVDLANGHDSARLTVTRDGRPVDLEPYLGALGHLVVVRVDDLSYLHVHPEEGATPTFAVAGLAPGRYRYFFDFKVGGVVRTAAYTVDIGQGHDHD
jgi:hypothetical protein